MTSPHDTPLRRIFVVGCPRSGTTVTQSMLAGLPGVMSMGETEFMLRLLGRFEGWMRDIPGTGEKWRRRLGLVHGPTARKLQECMDRAFGGSGQAPRLRRQWTGRAYVGEFCRVMDAMAVANGARCWVEKTPDHLAYVDVLAELIPDAHFLHVVRRGEDVVASAIDGQLRFAEHNVFYGTIPYWIDRWNRSVRSHIEHAADPRHTVLPYECLFTATDEVRTLLRGLAGVPAGEADSGGDSAIADLAQEPWKRGSTDGVLRPPESKSAQMFGPRMQQLLGERMTDYDEVIHALADAQPQLPWVARAAGASPPAAAGLSAS